MAHVFFGDRNEQQSAGECSTRVVEHLSRGNALAVFDNFETVATDKDLVRWLAHLRAPGHSSPRERCPEAFGGRSSKWEGFRGRTRFASFCSG